MLESEFFERTSGEHVATAIFRVETSMNNEDDPPESTYGAREKNHWPLLETADGSFFRDF